jgi:hypothetical protein
VTAPALPISLPAHNRPGLPEVAFRPGTHATFLEWMLARVRRQAVPGADGQPVRPLAAVGLSGPWSDGGQDWDVISALLDAWAAAGGVLAFYQERIANEAYLGTAAERFSVERLVSSLGYPLAPGVAAEVWLAFTVGGGSGVPAALALPAGTAAVSAPVPGGKPQPFETVAAVVARAEWNAMRPLVPTLTLPQRLHVGSREARLAGVVALPPGAPVLLWQSPRAWVFGTVTHAEPDPAAGLTLLRWSPAPGTPGGAGEMPSPALLTFAASAPLFGNDAAPWAALPVEEKRRHRGIRGGVFRLAPGAAEWVSAGDGLPAAPVRALACVGGEAYAAGAAGVFRWTGTAWAPASGPSLREVWALAGAPDGGMAAGTAGGQVTATLDGGASWDAVTGVRTVETTGAGGGAVRFSVPAALPQATVRALLPCTVPPAKASASASAAAPAAAPSTALLLAATDAGVFAASGAGGAWTPQNGGLPGSSASSPRAGAVWSLAAAGALAWAGTDAGVYQAAPAAGPDAWAWTPAGTGLALRVDALSAGAGVDGALLVAGTAQGAFRWSGVPAAPWTPMNAGFPTPPPAVRALLAPSGPTPLPAGGRHHAHRPPLYAATSAGVWLWDTATAGWTPVGAAPAEGPASGGGAATAGDGTADGDSSNEAAAARAGDGTADGDSSGDTAGTMAGRAWSGEPGSQDADASPAGSASSGEGVPVDVDGSDDGTGTPASSASSCDPDPVDADAAAGCASCDADSAAGGASAAGCGPSGDPDSTDADAWKDAAGCTCGMGGASPPGGDPASAAAGPEHDGPVPPPRGLNNPDVRALAALPDGTLLAATPFLGFDPDEWPGPPIRRGVVHLSQAVSQAVPGGTLVLQRARDADGPAAVAVRRIVSARQVRHTAYGITRTVTRLGVHPPCGLAGFGMRGTTAFVAPDGVSVPAPDASHPAGTKVPPPLLPRSPSFPSPPADAGAGADAAAGADPDPACALPASHASPAGPAAAPAGSAGGIAVPGLRVQPPAPLLGCELTLAGVVPALESGRTISVAGRRIRAALAPVAGVFARGGEGGWEPLGLASVDVVAVAACAGGLRLACVGGDPTPAGPAPGLYARAPGDADWTAAAGDAAGVPGVALAADADGGAWAAGADAVFRSADGRAWSRAGAGPAPGGITCLALEPGGAALAGTAADGVFRLAPGAAAWEPYVSGLDDSRVCALVVLPGGAVLAGTPSGVYRRGAGARDWEPLGEGLASPDVRALAVTGAGDAFAGTAGGVFALRWGAARWTAQADGLRGAALDVRALAVDAHDTAWAGTRGAGCWRRAEGASRWTPAPPGAANDVRALAAGGGGVLAGCGGAPLLVSAAGTAAPLGLDARFAVSAAWAAELGRGTLPDALRREFARHGAPLASTACVLPPAPGGEWRVRDTAGAYVLRLDAGAIRVRAPRDFPVVLAAPAPGADASVVAVRMRTGPGGVGALEARPGELAWHSAAPDDPAAAETARVLGSASPDPTRTVLTLAAPLAGAYDAADATVCANLAPATHGATVVREVLGDGNGTLGGQTFTLAAPPLTYVRPSTPDGTGSTLVVRVDGVAWSEVDEVYGQPASARVYQVRLDEAGGATVSFGDGVHGARLPTGRENVVARYRSGIGPAGDVPAGAIAQLGAAPAGVLRVTNPEAAAGGLPGETAAGARAAAPLRARVLGRVVALDDYQSFALTFAGIAGAATTRLMAGGAPLVVVTVEVEPAAAAADGGVAAAGELSAAIRLARGDATPFRVLPCERVPFRVEVTVTPDPRYVAAAVAGGVAEALAEALSGGRRALARPVASSQALAAAQGVPGVVGVRLDALHLSAGARAVRETLPALPARRDEVSAAVLPAQRLVPDPDRGITVCLAEVPCRSTIDRSAAPPPAGRRERP